MDALRGHDGNDSRPGKMSFGILNSKTGHVQVQPGPADSKAGDGTACTTRDIDLTHRQEFTPVIIGHKVPSDGALAEYELRVETHHGDGCPAGTKGADRGFKPKLMGHDVLQLLSGGDALKHMLHIVPSCGITNEEKPDGTVCATAECDVGALTSTTSVCFDILDILHRLDPEIPDKIPGPAWSSPPFLADISGLIDICINVTIGLGGADQLPMAVISVGPRFAVVAKAGVGFDFAIGKVFAGIRGVANVIKLLVANKFYISMPAATDENGDQVPGLYKVSLRDKLWIEFTILELSLQLAATIKLFFVTIHEAITLAHFGGIKKIWDIALPGSDPHGDGSTELWSKKIDFDPEGDGQCGGAR